MIVDDRDIKIIYMRLGHYDGHKYTFASIGEEIKVRIGLDRNKSISMNRVTQIYNKLLRKIRKEYLKDMDKL
jgi:DNA-directed RNA polymerase sigma subunit (sigma70/sigma32)